MLSTTQLHCDPTDAPFCVGVRAGIHTFFHEPFLDFPVSQLCISSDTFNSRGGVDSTLAAPHSLPSPGTSPLVETRQLDVTMWTLSLPRRTSVHAQLTQSSLTLSNSGPVTLPTFPSYIKATLWRKHRYELSHPGFPPMFPMCFWTLASLRITSPHWWILQSAASSSSPERFLSCSLTPFWEETCFQLLCFIILILAISK